MKTEELKKLEKHGISHSHYNFEFDVHYDNWTDFMSALGKQLDKLEVKMSDVTKIEWEGSQIMLSCLKIFVMEDKKLKRLD